MLQATRRTVYCLVLCSTVSSTAATAQTLPAELLPAPSLRESLESTPAASKSASQEPVFGAPSGPPFAHFVTDLFRDITHLPSKENALWLGLGLSVAGSAQVLDRPMSSRLSSAKSLETVFAPGATIGGARVQAVSALATYTIGQITRNTRVAALGSDLVRAQLLTQVLTGSIKMAVRRGRPDGTEFSFPSGHTSTSFASATVLQQHFGWKVGVPAYALATYVATSRIQEKRHFLSDVAFGASLGIMAGRTVTVGRGDARFALAPMAAPGGAGVSFNWVGSN